MPKIPLPSPQKNRLRAAAALLPIINSGLTDSKLTRERAALMASFVEWAAKCSPEDELEHSLLEEIQAGLGQLKIAFDS